MAGRVKDVLTNRGKAGVVLKFVTGPNAGKTATSGSDGTFHFTSLQQVQQACRSTLWQQLPTAYRPTAQWQPLRHAVDLTPCTPS